MFSKMILLSFIQTISYYPKSCHLFRLACDTYHCKTILFYLFLPLQTV